jgi:hypothetical protein
MKIAILGLIVIAVIGVLIAMRRTPAKKLLAANVQTGLPANPYHCVAIHHRDGACVAVERLSGQRFLSKDAPPLPLPACNAPECRCRYVHFDDRRQGDERRNPHPMLAHIGGYQGRERRAGEERRRLVPEDMDAGAMRG